MSRMIASFLFFESSDMEVVCSGFFRSGQNRPSFRSRSRHLSTGRNRPGCPSVHARPDRGGQRFNAIARGDSWKSKGRLVFFMRERGIRGPPLKSSHRDPLAGPQRAYKRQQSSP